MEKYECHDVYIYDQYIQVHIGTSIFIYTHRSSLYVTDHHSCTYNKSLVIRNEFSCVVNLQFSKCTIRHVSIDIINLSGNDQNNVK